MKNAAVVVVTLACVLLVGSQVQAQAPSSQKSAGQKVISGTVGSDMVTATATVVKVDQKNRIVTLKGEDGTVEDIEVGDEVKNLPQVKAGVDLAKTAREISKVLRGASAQLQAA